MLVVFALTLLLHTNSELIVWENDWNLRVAEAGWALSIELAAEWRDVMSRHPEYRKKVITSETETTSPPVTTYAPSVEQWRTLVEAYFPAESVSWAMRVMSCESNGNPLALNPSSGAAGLFQFIPSTWMRIIMPNLGFTTEQVWDPASNVAAAAWLFAAEGPTQWSCR
jgi:soluble lytic murein transglycosylase-like protein